MSGINNSELLEQLLAYAKAYGGSKKSVLSAERFLISVLDTVSGTASITIGYDEKTKLVKLLESVFSGDRGFESLRKALVEHLSEKRDVSYVEGLYFQMQLSKAKSTAEKQGMALLEPYLLLSCILEDPDDFFKGYQARSGEGRAEDTVQDTDEEAALLEELDEKFDALFGDEEKEVPDGEAPGRKQDKNSSSRIIVAELTAKAKSIHERLTESVFGQDNAVSVFTTGYFRAELLSLTDKTRTRPKATFLFAGPPGVGKTFLAEKAAELLQLPYQRFDMSEYANKEANLEFCGSDKVYKNGKEGNVTSFVADHPKCVVLFDEIEKAHINVIHLFLQILDAGRIRDNFSDKEVSFTDAILIFTTNAGKQLYENADSSDFSGVTRKVILKALQNDVNPETKTPYFPTAICSRFASGNVVMFNYVSAHHLRRIAQKEVLRHAANFEKAVGITVGIDEPVYTALLFAEGGTADARTIRSRAESFFDDELFELFRLLDSDRVSTGIENLESIHIGVELPEDQKEIFELFECRTSFEVLVFAGKEYEAQWDGSSRETRFFNARNGDAAKKLLRDHDFSFVLVDMIFGKSGNEAYLNVEDVDSEARDFFWFVRETYPDIPVYLLETPERKLNAEEKLSFLRLGVRGVITLSGNKEEFASEIKTINEQLHQQRSMTALARANKLVSFETAQSVRNSGKTAEITLFDFEMKVAVEAEDSQNILNNVSKPDVRFEQVIGAEDAKKELRYFVEYLKNPKKYLGAGVSAPKGVLLYGPPGTGKTMLAKAMASESDVTFITAEGNQFVNKYQGEGRDRVKELFRTAHKYAPSIVFIDEIDAIAKERRGGENSADTEVTLTALLTEMDGFKNDTTKPVFVLAATNFDVRPGTEKSLDPALMRRFDRRVYIDLPTKEERIRYIRMKLSEKPAFALSEEKIGNIAVRSTGMSLAELESVMELSLRTAIRDGDLRVTDAVFEEAFEIFNGGEAKNWGLSQLERIARHEAGHAFLCWHSGELPSYLTIVARGDHGGYMQHADQEDKQLYTKEELLAKIRISLGGRAAEIVYYGEKEGLSTGASGDLESATNLARHMICSYGMDEKFGLAFIDRRGERTGELSEKVREAVNRILADEMQKALTLIRENKPVIDVLVERLLSENHLPGDAMKKIFETALKG